MAEGSLAKARSGLSPQSLAVSLAPILVLLGSQGQHITTLQLALLQLCTIFVVQFASILLKVTEKISKPVPLPAVQPIKVEVINTKSPKKRSTSFIEEPPPHTPSRSQSRKAVDAPSIVQELPAHIPADVAPVVLESDLPAPLAYAGIPSRAIEEHAMYSNESIDSCLRNFLAILEHSQLEYLPKGAGPTPAMVPLDDWEQMLATPSSKVAKHPSIPHLYSISASYPDVPLRNIWELLIDINGRTKWDSMCYATEDIEAIGLDDQSEAATRQATVSYLATKGMFPVKANDMVLLSVNARLKPGNPLRLVCASTSVDHPSKPPTRSYTRMKLSVSGFIATDDGLGGCKVTQLTDLSALGSWVPGKIIKMVTETMIPKSLVKIGEAAKDYKPAGVRSGLHGEAWLPPVIGSWDAPPPAPAVTKPLSSKKHLAPTPKSDLEDIDSDIDADEPDRDGNVENIPASSARDIRELVVQLRHVNTRLAQLEKTAVAAPPAHALDSTPPNGPANGHAGYHPPAPPFGVSKITENAVTAAQSGGPMGWLGRLAGSMNLSNFVGGLGAGIFSTTTAATLAALVVYYIRKRR